MDEPQSSNHNSEAYDRQIDAAFQRLETLRQRSSEIPASQQALQAEALEELAIALEELQVAGEELRQQNEELVITRQAVETERQRYQELFTLAPDGYLVTDAAGVIQEVNRAAATLLDQDQDRLRDKPLLLFIAKGDRQNLHNTLTRLQKGDLARLEEWDLRIQPRAQASVPVAATVATVRDAAGRLTGLRWLLRDISRRKQAERRLHFYTKRLETLHTLDQAILVGQPLESAAQVALNRLRDLTPYHRASVVAFSFATDEATLLAVRPAGDTELGQGTRLPLAMFEITDEFRRGQEFVVEDLLSRPGRTTSEPSRLDQRLQTEGMRAFLSVPLIAEDELLGALNLGWDRPGPVAAEHVTVAREVATQLAVAIWQARLRDRVQRQTAELEQRVTERTADLHQQRNFISAVLDTSGALVVVIDQEGRIVRFNRTCEQLTGYTFEEVEGRPFWDLFLLPEEREAVMAVVSQLKAGQYPNKHENHWLARDGRQHLIAWSNTVLLDAEGAVEYIIGTGIDITERRQMEDEKDQLLAAVSQHRERLRALTGQLAEAQETERKELVHELHDQVGQNLMGLDLNLIFVREQIPETWPEAESIRSRLDDSLSLLEEMGKRIENVMVDLHPPVLDDYGLLSALRWYGRRIAVRVAFDIRVEGREPEPRLATPVEHALFRITQEALTNVAKHAQATQVIVSLEVEEEAVRLTIADNGNGFDPPSPVETAARRGWGLLTMTERAEAIGGHCRIESRAGEGTTVIVEVPR